MAKIEGKPLYRVFADRYLNGVVDDKVWVYAAGSYCLPPARTHKGPPERIQELPRPRLQGLLGGTSLADDIHRIEAALEVVGEGKYLAVDVNGHFDLDTAVKYAAPRPTTH